ncbi:unnamed protein product [Phytomonas sp. EM1]|nr:unnamed protein product [Phytomonas sp. EM1]|eukprot:CCW62829.1 unnamed protein product [Phytomonas sp. isolate EM1]
MPQEQFFGLPVHSLVDVLSELPLPDGCSISGVSRKWRCVLAPSVPSSKDPIITEDHDEKVMSFLEAGIPVFVSSEYSQDAYQQCGPNAIALVTDPRWNKLTKPQIALKAGWGSPGTHPASSCFHKLVNSVARVFNYQTETDIASEVGFKKVPESGLTLPTKMKPPEYTRPSSEVLEMQLFHSEEVGFAVRDGVRLPPIANRLCWPTFLGDMVPTAVATCISGRGLIRWWQLNDCAEFLIQAALPLPTAGELGIHPDGSLDASGPHQRVAREVKLGGEGGNPDAPVRVYLFGEKGSYDWFLHDDESAVSEGRVVALDIFNTPDEALPNDPSLLPIIIVALVHAGGEVLLVPPNAPYMSLTLRHSVLIEKRGLNRLWLDELSYFLIRCARLAVWPAIYDYVEVDLQNEDYVTQRLIPSLFDLLRRSDGGGLLEGCLRRRAAASLLAIVSHPTHFALSPASREALTRTLHSEAGGVLSQPTPPGSPGSGPVVSLEDATRARWALPGWRWPRPGCVLQARDRTGAEWVLPVVYVDHRPVFGVARQDVEETRRDYATMSGLVDRPKALWAYLRSRKSPDDALLEELF